MKAANRNVDCPELRVNLTEQELQKFRGRTNFEGPLPDQSKPYYEGLDRCHVWTGTKRPFGYGSFGFGFPQKWLMTHRIMWALTHGCVPAGMHVLHKCDNPSCLNPNHLFLGTCSENGRDRNAKGRTVVVTGDRHGSRTKPWTWIDRKSRPKDTYVRGEQVCSAKLTEAQVREIRSRGLCTSDYPAVAEEFGVTRHNVSMIVRGIRWKHLL